MMAAWDALPVLEVLFLFFTGRGGSFLSQKEKEKNGGANRADRAARPCMVQRKQKGAAICCPLTGVTMAGYPAGASGTSRVFRRCIAGNGSGYFRDLVVLFRFCCLSVFHAANVGVVNFHSLWCVFGPFYFLFMHHNFLDEEPQQLRC